MIKAIIFDWGGVLIQDPASKLMSSLASYLGVPIHEFTKTYLVYEKSFQRNEITEQELWRKVGAQLKIPSPRKSLWGKAAEKVFTENKAVAYLAKRLKNKGYKIGFLSNTDKPTMGYFKKQSYSQLFDVCVFSCVEGMIKPNPKIYKLTLKRLRVSPDEAVFIDDKAENVKGARSVGAYSVLFTNTFELKKELNKLRVR